MDRKHRLAIMARIRAAAKDGERRHDATAVDQACDDYRELATDAEWKRRPAYMREAVRTVGAKL